MILNWKEILKSPRFWAALLAILFVILSATVPAIAAKLDKTAITEAVVALVIFIAAASVGNQPSYINIFGSFRFWSLLASLVFIFLRAFLPSLPISEELVQVLIGTLGTASVGVSYRPVGTTLLTPTQTPPAKADPGPDATSWRLGV
jgi:uncharacterized membrane protein